MNSTHNCKRKEVNTCWAMMQTIAQNDVIFLSNLGRIRESRTQEVRGRVKGNVVRWADRSRTLLGCQAHQICNFKGSHSLLCRKWIIRGTEQKPGGSCRHRYSGPGRGWIAGARVVVVEMEGSDWIEKWKQKDKVVK